VTTTKTTFQDEMTAMIAEFLNRIGLAVVPAAFDGPTFLPGILVEKGRLLVDETRLEFPGDLLHEGGHLAVAPAAVRSNLSGEIILPGAPPGFLEAQAVGWSYAACLHLGLDPGIVFHDGGYRGNSRAMLLNFSLGVYFGVEQLEEAGLTATPKRAAELGLEPYPKMRKWLRD
jgi:hypothetical protein